MSTRDDFYNSGYGSSMSYDTYVRTIVDHPRTNYAPHYFESESEIACDPISIPKTVSKRPLTPSKKIITDACKRETLMKKAAEIAPTLGYITEREIDDWRIANGYLWEAISPKGVVYREVIKSVTIDDPNYAYFHALKIKSDLDFSVTLLMSGMNCEGA